MSKFLIEIGNSLNLDVPNNSDEVIAELTNGKFYFIKRYGPNKFPKDECFYSDDQYIIVLVGVVSNTNLLKQQYKENWASILKQLYVKNGDTFYKELRGSFSGLLYDKQKDKWIIFADQIGSKHIYYTTSSDDKFIFASDIVDIYKYNKINYDGNKVDINSSYMLLSYGYMVEDNTLVENIKKILPGNYAKIEKNNLSIHEYYKFTNTPNYDLSENEIIKKMNELFRQAIKRQFDKDEEYNYKHLVALSGGLDSRMTSWVAHEMGYTNQLNSTFSQSDYLDETIPKQIAADLKHEWIFKALDNGLFLEDVDEVTEITGGNVLYYGLAHGLSLYKYINFSNLGVLHSGQLGDVIIGTYSSSNFHSNTFDIKSGAFSEKFINRIDFTKINTNYENEEMFKIYQRGFSGINTGLLVAQEFTETMSPFCDVDFLEFALSIPVELRFNHKLYKKWISINYPKAGNYIWEKTKTKPLEKMKWKIGGRTISLHNFPSRVFRKLGITKDAINTKNHMNPLDYWYKTNGELRSFVNTYFNENIDSLKNEKELSNDLSDLFTNGLMSEKVQVLSLLSFIKKMELEY